MMNNDVISHVCRYMNDKQKIYILSITVAMNKLKSEILFTKPVMLDHIVKLSYFDQFRNIIVQNRFKRLPKSTKVIRKIKTAFLRFTKISANATTPKVPNI